MVNSEVQNVELKCDQGGIDISIIKNLVAHDFVAKLHSYLTYKFKLCLNQEAPYCY